MLKLILPTMLLLTSWLWAAPLPGQTAPDFILTTADGSRQVQLSRLYASRPVVLIFGSYM